MKVKLLKDVLEGGNPKTTVRRRRAPIFWEAGEVIEMSDASGAKYCKTGVAEKYVEPAKSAKG